MKDAKNEVLYNRIREAARKRGMTLNTIAEKFNAMYKTNDIYNSLKNWGAKSDPSATNLLRLSNVLDCDTDFLLGKQDCLKKNVDALAEKTGLDYDTMENMLRITKDKPDVCNIINDLFVEEREDPDTGEMYAFPSSFLLQLLHLCKINMGNPEITGYMAINDVYSGNFSQEVNTADYFQFERYNLYNFMCGFIREQRQKKRLPLYEDTTPPTL
jgi:transcriptional regulator with XRE-family HTH domain